MPAGRQTRWHSCFVSNALAFLALIAAVLPVPEAAPRCSTEITEVVRDYLEAVRTMNIAGCRLYTPTLSSYEQNCPNSTLTCFAKEAKVLIFEFEEALQESELHEDLPNRLMSVNTEKDKGQCQQCEVHEEEPVDTFLLTLQEILQVMNSRL